jgi:hypothetical protein
MVKGERSEAHCGVLWHRPSWIVTRAINASYITVVRVWYFYTSGALIVCPWVFEGGVWYEAQDFFGGPLWD